MQRQYAERLRAMAAGEEEAPGVLDARLSSLVKVGIYGAVTTLRQEALKSAVGEALTAGATGQEITEVLECVTVLGLHTWDLGASALWEALGGEEGVQSPDPERSAALRRRLASDPYWHEVDAALGGSFDKLVVLSPEMAEACIALAAVPWQRRPSALSAKIKELVYVAIDASPTHLYLPGLRFHLREALEAGSEAEELIEVLLLASLGSEAAAQSAGVELAEAVAEAAP